MKVLEFVNLVEDLTGSAVHLCSPTLGSRAQREKEKKRQKLLLSDALKSLDGKKINWNQFNELLLVCNKDRVSKDFFELFFRDLLNLSDDSGGYIPFEEIRNGIEIFRKFAMLGFGNFRFAFREISKLSKEEIRNKKELKNYFKSPTCLKNEFTKRHNKISRIRTIERQNTYLLGYYSGKNITNDLEKCSFLKELLESHRGNKKEFNNLLNDTIDKTKEKSKGIPELAKNTFDIFFNTYEQADLEEFADFIKKSDMELIKKKTELDEVRKKAEQNSDVYLTWDYMDVYIATSMRERWEFGTLHKFIQDLFDGKDDKYDLRELNLRYFDPTQSYEKSRIDKGLIEGLMLKRAVCTVYSVQETDTFGKDSELAGTLAQGKPVIAYVPKIDETNFEEHLQLIKEESSKSLEFLRDKMWLLSKEFREEKVYNECCATHEAINEKITDESELRKRLRQFERQITEHLLKKAWYEIDTPWAKDEDFISINRRSFELACLFVAIANKHFYENRANTFKRHPLGIQINLDTGVANGVLVVRNVQDCRRLLYKILTNENKYEIKYEKEEGFWTLKEMDVSECVFRVVTVDPKITNSFWNFYLIGEDGGPKHG